MRGFTILEVLIAVAIVSIIASLAAPAYQKYVYRAEAAKVVVQSDPIKRSIQESQGAMDKSRYQLRLSNATDGSIVGCQAPIGSACGAEGATAVEQIVSADKLTILDGTVRVSAATCETDCPDFALAYSSDLNVAGTTPPAPPAGKGQGKGQGKGKGGAWVPFISSAYAQSANFRLEYTNRVLYEFGEVMSRRVHESNNAECLLSSGTCTVTIKY